MSLKSRQSELPNAEVVSPQRESTEYRIAFFDDKPEVGEDEQLNPNIHGSTMAEQTSKNAESQGQPGEIQKPMTGEQAFRLRSQGENAEAPTSRFRSREDTTKAPARGHWGTRVSRFRTADARIPTSSLLSKYPHSSWGRRRVEDKEAAYEIHDASTDPRASVTWNKHDAPLNPTREEIARLKEIPSAYAQNRKQLWQPEIGPPSETDESGESKSRFKMQFQLSGIPDNIPRGRFKAIMRQDIVAAGGQSVLPHEALESKVPGGNEIDALSRRLESLAVAQPQSQQPHERRQPDDNPNNDDEVWPPPWRKVDFSDKRDRAHTEPLPVPVPSAEYLASARAEPVQSSRPKCFLLVLDLNGTLFFKPERRSSKIVPRPYVKEFLAYCLEEHKVLIWSSARPKSIFERLPRIFTPPQQQRIVQIFSRNELDLTPEQYHGNPQVYKKLETVWGNPKVNLRHPDKQGATWSQKDTVLIDDSYLKAAKQPYNHMEVPEFDPYNTSDGRGKQILAQVVDYLEKARQYEDVSAYIYKHQFRAKYVKDYVRPERKW